METKGKDKYITKLTMDMKKMDPKTKLKPVPNSKIQERFDKLRETAQAHQTRNVYLSSELVRVEQEANSKLLAKDKTINRLENDIEELSKEFQELRKQNYLLKGADNNDFQELEKVKKAYV